MLFSKLIENMKFPNEACNGGKMGKMERSPSIAP